MPYATLNNVWNGTTLRPRSEVDFTAFGAWCRAHVYMDSSPGYPWITAGLTKNYMVFDKYGDEGVAEMVYTRLSSRLEALRSGDKLELSRDYDVIKMFIKDEPHKLKKIREHRERLIASVSLIDQLCSACFFEPINDVTTLNWEKYPINLGFGLDDNGAAKFVRKCLRWFGGRPVVGVDNSMWDWKLFAFISLAGYLVMLTANPAIKRDKDSLRESYDRWYTSDITGMSDYELLFYADYLLTRFKLYEVDGDLYEVDNGVWPSGHKATLLLNSWNRVLVCYSVGGLEIQTQGDDAVEPIAGLTDRLAQYATHGLVVEVSDTPDGAWFEFCSNYWFKQGYSVPANAGKMIYGFFLKKPSDELFRSFHHEFRNSPLYDSACALARAVGWLPKDGDNQVALTD